MASQVKPKPKPNSVEFFRRRPVRAVVGFAALAFAYMFGLRALDTGNLLNYLFAIVFITIALREFVGAVRRSNTT